MAKYKMVDDFDDGDKGKGKEEDKVSIDLFKSAVGIFKKDATRVYTDVFSEVGQWVNAIKAITTKYPNKDEEISVSASSWADRQLE